jgi:hypothetical protein
LNAPAAPGRILASYPTDQMANLRVELWTADRLGSGLPSPVELEAAAVPGQDGGGLHDGQAGPPSHPDAGQPDPEDPVPTGEPGSGDRALKNPELVAQGEILEGDGHRPEQQGAEERPETEHEEHGAPRHQT